MTLLSIPALVMSGITLYVGLYYLLMWLRIREEKSYAYFAGLCATVAIYDVFSVLLYNSRGFAASVWHQRGQFSTIAAIALWLILFTMRFLRRKITLGLWLLFGFYAIFVFAAWIDSPLFLQANRPAPKIFRIGSATIRYLEVEPGPLLAFFYLLIFGGILLACVFFLRPGRSHSARGPVLFQASMVVFFLGTVNDMLVGSGLVRSLYLLEYSFLAVILAMDFMLQSNYLALINKEKIYARELEAYLEKVKSLKGLVPICSYCKKIQDDAGKWLPIEHFIAQHSDADFSHGICPECAGRMYPDLIKKEKN